MEGEQMNHDLLRKEFDNNFCGESLYTNGGLVFRQYGSAEEVFKWFIEKLEPLEAENTKLHIENNGLKSLGEMYGRQVADLQAKLTEAEKALSTAHKIFGSESDKLGSLIKSVEAKLTAANELLEKAEKALSKLTNYVDELSEDIHISRHYPSNDIAKQVLTEIRANREGKK